MTFWKRITLLSGVFLILLGSYNLSSQSAIPNHKDVVTQARSKFANLSGEKRAFCVVQETVWNLRTEGAGSFYKTSGTQYNERSIDIIIYKPNKETFDILGDAENSAEPAWNRTKPTGFGDIKLWRAPVDPATVGCGTSTPPPPIGDDRKKLIEIRDSINEYLGEL